MQRRRRNVTTTLVTLFCLLGIAIAPLSAAPLPSRDGNGAASEPRQVVSDFLERDDVAEALAASGLSRDQVEERLAQLDESDIRHLAGHLEQVQTAGAVPRYIWILLGIFLGVLILGAIF